MRRIYRSDFARFNPIDRCLPALKAPAKTSPGQRPGFRNPSIAVRPEGAQGLPPPFQGGRYSLGHDSRGAAPGWHPPRRWRDIVIVALKILPEKIVNRFSRLQPLASNLCRPYNLLSTELPG